MLVMSSSEMCGHPNKEAFFWRTDHQYPPRDRGWHFRFQGFSSSSLRCNNYSLV